MAQCTGSLRTERLRRQFKPRAISVLFVGESAPASGDFFYRADSKLFDTIYAAFVTEYHSIPNRERFLDYFRSFGCYLDDLCLISVNRLDKKLRRSLRKRAERYLALRMSVYRPRAIVPLLSSIAQHVASAAAQVDLSSAVMPHVKWRDVVALVSCLRVLRRQGVLPVAEQLD